MTEQSDAPLLELETMIGFGGKRFKKYIVMIKALVHAVCFC